MSKLIAAHTNLDPQYPGYINFTREGNGSVSVYFRGDPSTVEGYVREGATSKLTLSAADFEAFLSSATQVAEAA